MTQREPGPRPGRSPVRPRLRRAGGPLRHRRRRGGRRALRDLWVLKGALTPLVTAFVIAYLLDPLIDRLERLGLGRRVRDPVRARDLRHGARRVPPVRDPAPRRAALESRDADPGLPRARADRAPARDRGALRRRDAERPGGAGAAQGLRPLGARYRRRRGPPDALDRDGHAHRHGVGARERARDPDPRLLPARRVRRHPRAPRRVAAAAPPRLRRREGAAPRTG